MRAMRAGVFLMLGAASLLFSSRAIAQITINEFVDDERTAGAGTVNPDVREFVELYNAGASAVDISGWTLSSKQLGSNFNLPAGTKTYTIPASQSIPASGYYVIGSVGVPNVNFTLTTGGFNTTTGTDFFPDTFNTTNGNYVMELRNTSSLLVDAVADETFRGTERLNLTDEQRAQVGGGVWGQDPSFNVSAPNTRFSQSRFQNGVDRNINGRDFGMLPLTPGASNNLPPNASHTIPNVDGLGLEDPVTQYYASFVMPRAIDPTNADGNTLNATAIPASPQGGKVIIAYDETGGGNVTYSKELVHKFKLDAYIETGPLNLVSATTLQRSEATIYGIGTSDGLFGTPNPIGSLTAVTSSSNGSTGVGWMIERVESYNAGAPATVTSLLLVDFGDGGDSIESDREWEVMKRYTVTSSGWVRLGIDHNAATGVITATKDADTIVYSLPGDYNNDNKVDAADYVAWRKGGTLKNEAETPGTATVDDYASWRAHFGDTTLIGELGTFYAGYRDGLGGVFTTARPPTFDMLPTGGTGSIATAVPEPGTMGLAVIGMISVMAGRRRKAC